MHFQRTATKSGTTTTAATAAAAAAAGTEELPHAQQVKEPTNWWQQVASVERSQAKPSQVEAELSATLESFVTFTSTGAASTNCLSGFVPPPAPCCLATLAWLHDQPKASATSEPEPTAADSSSSFSRKHSRALRVNNSLRFSYFSRSPSLSLSLSLSASLMLSRNPLQG